jgi:hypothetical protein
MLVVTRFLKSAQLMFTMFSKAVAAQDSFGILGVNFGLLMNNCKTDCHFAWELQNIQVQFFSDIQFQFEISSPLMSWSKRVSWSKVKPDYAILDV